MDGKEPPLFAKGYLDKAVSKAKALRAMDDAKAIVDRLHEAAMVRFPFSGLLPEGVEGILHIRSTTAQLKD